MAVIDTILRLRDRFTRPMRGAINATERMETQARRTETSVDRLGSRMNRFSSGGFMSGIVSANQGLQLIQQGMQAIGNVTGIIDNYANTNARLNLINDGLQTTSELQDMIFASAKKSRGAYDAMASSVAKMGLLAKDAFGSNKELVGFTELVQKSFKVGGASTQEQQSGMYQLTQAMAAGKLQGDEFRSIMENAPMIAEAISKYTGVSKGELKSMSSEGTITADIIKNAMFGMADDINSKFNTMPRTFGDVMTNMKNMLTQTFGPAMQFTINALNKLLIVASNIGTFISNNWSIIEPIVIGIAGAITGYLVVALWSMIPPLVSAAIAWLALNWPILLIGAAIGLLLWWMLTFGDTAKSVLGFIGGLFGILFSFLYNKFAWLANNVLSVAEFFANVWKDPVYAVKKLFFDLAINALDYVGNMARGIETLLNKIPGVSLNITSSLDNFKSTLESARDSLKSEEDVVQLMRFKQQDLGEGFKIGEKIGAGVVDKVQGIATKIRDMSKLTELNLGKNGIDKIGTVGTVNKIKDDVNIAEEDIKLMKELATQKYVQNFVTLTPQVNTKIGKISKDVDSDRLIAKLSTRLIEEIENGAEGVYA